MRSSLSCSGSTAASAVERRDDDREEADQRDDHELGQDAEAQPDDQQRRDRRRSGSPASRPAAGRWRGAAGARGAARRASSDAGGEREREAEHDLLGGDEQVVPQQPAVVPQRRGDLVGRGQDEVVDRAQARVELPAAEQQRAAMQRRRGGASRRPSLALRSASQRPRAHGDDLRVGRRAAGGRAAASTAQVGDDARPGRGESTTTRSASSAASSTSWVTSSDRARRARAARPPAILHLGARDRVERAERLVEAQHRLARQQRAHERDALAHAARQLARCARARSRRGRARRTARARCARASSRAGARQAQRQRRVVERVEPRQQQVALGHQHRAAARPACRRRARCSPQTSSSSVDLPQPLGPTTATTSPRRDAQRDVLQRAPRPRRAGAVTPSQRRTSPSAGIARRLLPRGLRRSVATRSLRGHYPTGSKGRRRGNRFPGAISAGLPASTPGVTRALQRMLARSGDHRARQRLDEVLELLRSSSTRRPSQYCS